jgi:hypothetical protein
VQHLALLPVLVLEREAPQDRVALLHHRRARRCERRINNQKRESS